jgi:hypothetical protein
MAAAFSLEPPNQDSASASKSDKLLVGFQYFTEQPYGLVSAVVTGFPASTSSKAATT